MKTPRYEVVCLLVLAGSCLVLPMDSLRFLIHTAAALVAVAACRAWPSALAGGPRVMASVFLLSLAARLTLLASLLVLGAPRDVRVEAVLVVFGYQMLESLLVSRTCWGQSVRPRTEVAA